MPNIYNKRYTYPVDAGELFEEAQRIYLDALNAGTPKHKLASFTAEKTGMKVRRIRNWAKRFGWRDTIQKP